MRPKSVVKEEAIRQEALRIIAEEGLENLSMQRLAKAAGISPRTIYIKYENKEDLLVKLFIDVVLGAYETAVLKDFSEDMTLDAGVTAIWRNTFHYFRKNRERFVLMQYGRSSPLLNKAYQERDIGMGAFFAPIHRFLQRHVRAGLLPRYPHEVLRALLFAPLFDLVQEYFEYRDRPRQIITEKLVLDAAAAVIRGLKKPGK
ncbi:TetR/AcrR family transcriptional regulator [Taibaiella koreensis]|uniref:TetR/AcrR family transcriptional regulator n=1 Tax=Taibaiella koreensis TaxID=1268548 RepID=UPI000E59B8FC|nr:TetR/AcrR family transcriptional regulator [Taibaiella koreensis]